MIQKYIKNFETIKNNDGKYNSVMDEINRNYAIRKTIKTNYSIEKLFFIVATALHQSFNYEKIFLINKSFSVKQLKPVKAKYYKRVLNTIEYLLESYKYLDHIIFRWKNKNDIYWVGYQFIKTKKGSKLIYSEQILKEDTISGIQGVLDKNSYKFIFKQTCKLWKSLLISQKDYKDQIERLKIEISEYQENNFAQITKLRTDLEVAQRNKISKEEIANLRKELKIKNDAYNLYLDNLKNRLDKLSEKNLILEPNWISWYEDNITKEIEANAVELAKKETLEKEQRKDKKKDKKQN